MCYQTTPNAHLATHFSLRYDTFCDVSSLPTLPYKGVKHVVRHGPSRELKKAEYVVTYYRQL